MSSIRNWASTSSTSGWSTTCTWTPRIATIDMTLTSRGLPAHRDDRGAGVGRAGRRPDGGLVDDFRINWVWLPPWGPEKITEDGREQMRALGFNI